MKTAKVDDKKTFKPPLVAVSYLVSRFICLAGEFTASTRIMSAVDPWVITQKERFKYTEQFNTLQPVNGIVTGAQAKGFLLQSQLPPLVLGQIW